MFKLFKTKSIELVAPMEGEVIQLGQVPDLVFSSLMVGDGVAIVPTKGTVVAPCDGKIAQIFPTNHAIGLETEEGIEILIHIGIDTVNLKGEGFKRLLEPGQKVKQGTPIVEVDLDFLNDKSFEITTPVIITNMDQVKKIESQMGKTELGTTQIMKVFI